MINFRIGKYDCLESTNRFLLDIIDADNLEEGLVIQAEKQTAGKGYGHNSWESEKGKNLLFSVYLKPDFLAAGHQFYISMIVSLSVINVLKQITAKETFSIKWPNDIYFGEKKIAGILMENRVMGSTLSESIIGLGLNINQKDFPKYLPNPISLFQITNKLWDRDEILRLLLAELNKGYEFLQNGDMDFIKINYLDSLFLMNIKSKYIANNQYFEGTIKGIDDFGRLELLTEKGLQVFGFKEIELVLDSKSNVKVKNTPLSKY